MSSARDMGLFTRLGWWMLGLLGTLLIRLLYLTVRGSEVGLEHVARGRKDGKGPLVFALWHSRLLGNCYNNRGQGVGVMNSRHRDNEIIVRVIVRLGFVSVRGSSTRGGVAALKNMLHLMDQGHDLAFTVDGPRGPALKVKPGAVYAAARSGCPLITASVSYSSFWQIPSWDRFQVPRPFSRMVVGYGSPLKIPENPSEKEIERWCLEAERQLNRLTAFTDSLARPLEYRRGWGLAPLVEKFLSRERDRWYHWPLLALLLPFELAYRLLWFIREKLYDSGRLKAQPPSVPALCVGSLYLGGAGKTPLTILLTRALEKKISPVAVLTRGYGGSSGRGSEPLVLGPGELKNRPLRELARMAGDEAALILHSLEKTGMVVCGDRVKGTRAAVAELGAKALLLDDGFGHRRLGRTLDLLSFSESLLRANGHTLPAGCLREPRPALKRARALAIIRQTESDLPLPRFISRSGKPVLYFRRSPGKLVPLAEWHDGRREGTPAALLEGRPVFGFCGIADPEGFRQTLAALGAFPLTVLAFADHARYSAREQRELFERARGAGALPVTTEKDAVKLDLELIGPGCLVLCLELEAEDSAALDALLEELLV